MDPHQTVYALLIVLCGGFLQGTVAFGFGLLCVPLLLMIGIPMPVVLTIIAVCTAVQAGNGVHSLRHSVQWKEVGISLAVRSGAMILGVWTLHRLVSYPINQLKFWVGLTLLIMVLLQAVWRPAPRPKLPVGWDMTAFLSSGFTGGLCSMGGPPLLLWVMAHDWTAERTRAFLFASFMSMVPIQLVVLYWTFGHDVLHGMVLGAVLSPIVLLGSLLGLKLGNKISKPLLQKLVVALLVIIALNAMAPEIWRFLHKDSDPKITRTPS